jgi:hypothetical protein
VLWALASVASLATTFAPKPETEAAQPGRPEGAK